MTNRENFQSWFAGFLRPLCDNPAAGFIVTLVSFPLLERYLRQAARSEPNSPRFIVELRRVFHELLSDVDARAFWTTYRHGLLHNVTMFRETHGLTHDCPHAIEIQSDGKVWLNPALFSRRVVETIEGDFATFEGGSPPLPSVYYGRAPLSDSGSSYYRGTGTPPGQGAGKR